MRDRLFWIAMAALGGGLLLLFLNHDAGEVFGLPNDTFARTLYLTVLGIVVGAAVVARNSFGNIARNVAIWLFILLVLVAGYQYRYELQDIASRVTAGLVPGSPLSIEQGADGTLVMLDKAAGGHFVVRAEVDGTTISTLVDTGATSTVLSATDAERVGYDVDRLDFRVPVMTANGTARAAQVVADEIRVGAIARRRIPILVATPGQLGQSLLGMDFLGTLSGFDVHGDRMILRD